MKIKKSGVIIGIVAILILSSLFFFEVAANGKTEVKILSDEMSHDDYSVWVSGLAQNVAGEELRSVRIKASFFDAEDIFLGTESYTEREIPTGATFRFNITTYDIPFEDIAYYQISVDSTSSIPGFELILSIIALISLIMIVRKKG